MSRFYQFLMIRRLIQFLTFELCNLFFLFFVADDARLMAKRPSIEIKSKDVIRLLVPRLIISIKTALWCHCYNTIKCMNNIYLNAMHHNNISNLTGF